MDDYQLKANCAYIKDLTFLINQDVKLLGESCSGSTSEAIKRYLKILYSPDLLLRQKAYALKKNILEKYDCKTNNKCFSHLTTSQEQAKILLGILHIHQFPDFLILLEKFLLDASASGLEELLNAISAAPAFKDKESSVKIVLMEVAKKKNINQFIERINTLSRSIKVSELLSCPSAKLSGLSHYFTGKIAICISGQLRNYYSAFKTWNKIIDSFNGCDIYIHTWDTLGMPSLFNEKSHRIFGEKSTQWLEIIRKIKAYRQTPDSSCAFKCFYSIGQAEYKDIKKLYNTSNIIIESENDEDFRNMSNLEKMFYKISACHNYARSSSTRYDGYLRIRPDIVLPNNETLDLPKLLSISIKERVVFSGTGTYNSWFGYGCDDKIAFGSPDVMDCYSSNTYPAKIPSNGHTHLANRLDGFNIVNAKIDQFRPQGFADLSLTSSHVSSLLTAFKNDYNQNLIDQTQFQSIEKFFMELENIEP